jgi:hypothetical protein
MTSYASRIFTCSFVLFLFSAGALAQHLVDPEFQPTVEHPAFTKNSPRVMFDEAHFNFHTSTNRYKPFADLLMNDGYRVVVNRQPFSKKTLDTFKIVVVVNALGNDIDEPDADKPALSEEETAALRDWVHAGGSLLLIADANTFAKAAAPLGKQFGVELIGNVVEEGNSSDIEYTRENQRLMSHSITTGRVSEERINRVMVFNGQSLKGPSDSVAFLKSGDSVQGLALKFGGGRVVVLGDAEMLTALLSDPPKKDPIGMNYPDVDNKQLALNIMHWLSLLTR